MNFLSIIRGGAVALPCVLTWAVPHASADAIVYDNNSGLWGSIQLFDSGQNFDSTGWEFFPSSAGWPHSGHTPPPLSGAWTDSEARVISGRGATGSASTSIAGLLSATEFITAGAVSGVASADSAAPAAGATAFGQSFLDIAFRLDQPHTFTYTAQHFGQSESPVFAAWGSLRPSATDFGGFGPHIFQDDFAGLPGALDVTRTYSGILGPGFYHLEVGSGVLVEAGALLPSTTGRASARALGGFDATFSLTPVPEPATVLLLGGGLLMAARRARRRNRQR